MARREKDVFISYGREEGVREFVKRLKVGLEAGGVSVWLDVDDIPAGSDFHQEIALAVQSCRALVAVLTKKYTQSNYCTGELYFANSQRKVLLPVVYEDGWDEGKEGAGVRLTVSAYNWTFFRPNNDDYHESLRKLVQGAKLKLGIHVQLPNSDAEGMINSLKGVIHLQKLGNQLNISQDQLSHLLKSCQSGDECRGMITYWLNYDNDASWEKLANALFKIGENKVAEKIVGERALPRALLEKVDLPSPDKMDTENVDSTFGAQTMQGNDYTAEDKQAMNMTNQEEIKHHFAMLIDNLRNALILVAVLPSDITRYLRDTSVIDFHTQFSDIEAIFDHLQSKHCWSYMNYGLVEHLNRRFLEAKHRSIKPSILEYKGRFNGYLAMEKIIASEFFVEANEFDDIEDPAQAVAKYGQQERCKLRVKLKLGGRKLSEVSLTYIAEVWESFQEEYELPSLTAQIDYIMESCLEIAWLISPMDAEKIRTSTKSHDAFFQKYKITLVTLDDYTVFKEEPEGEQHSTGEKHSKATEPDPESALASLDKAEVLFQQQQFPAVEECCTESIALDDSNPKPYFIRAKARAKMGKLELAVADFHSTLKLDPNNMQANVQSARLEGELRRREKRPKQECSTGKGDAGHVPQQAVKEKCSLGSSGASRDVCEIPREASQAAAELDVAHSLDEWEITLNAILGEQILVTSNLSSHVPVSILEQEGAVVGLFFSGSWCPPSSEFTPRLVNWYNRFKRGPNGNLLNIVFVSSDFDDESWREYCAEMPWYTLDYKDRDKESKLSARFKVDAIPTLIFVEGNTGKLITKDGRSIIDEDPTGDGFPWKPKPFHEVIAGTEFVDQDNKRTTWDQIKGKTIGLFFSADWCIPGQRLTPTIVATYHKLKESRQDFEFIYVSSDRSEEEWRTSLSSMPWISFPFNDKRTDTLRTSFHIDSIPSLILLDEKGGVITTEGVSYIFNDPDGEMFPWYVNELTEYTADDINETAYVIWFVSKDTASTAHKVLEPLAKEYISKKAEKNMEVKLMFFIANDENDASRDIREKAKLPRKDPVLAIIDVPRNQVHVAEESEVSEPTARKFICDYLARRLMGRRLS